MSALQAQLEEQRELVEQERLALRAARQAHKDTQRELDHERSANVQLRLDVAALQVTPRPFLAHKAPKARLLVGCGLDLLNNALTAPDRGNAGRV